MFTRKRMEMTDGLAEVMHLIPSSGCFEVSPLNYPGVYVGMCEFSPEVAKTILDSRNQFNRPSVSNANVNFIASAIEADEFMITGETIIFDEDGNLRNGQHRLRAVLKANKSIFSIAVFGVEESAFEVMDRGKTRSLGDALEVKHGKNLRVRGRDVSPAIPALHQFLLTGKIAKQSAQRLSFPQMLKFYEAHPRLSESVACLPRSHIVWGGSPVTAVILHYVLGEIKHPDRDAFFRGLIEHTHASADPRWNGVRAIWSKAINLLRTTPNRRHEISFTRDVWFGFLIKTWNHYATNCQKDMSLLRLTTLEKYPQIEGLRYGPDGVPCDPRLPGVEE